MLEILHGDCLIDLAADQQNDDLLVVDRRDLEAPVNPNLRSQDDEDLGPLLNLPAAATVELKLCRNAFILSLAFSLETGRCRVHYSRNHNFYSNYRRSLPRFWTYRNVMAAVDSLDGQPDIVFLHRETPQNPRTRTGRAYRSYIEAGISLLRADLSYLTRGLSVDPAERIVIRDRNGESIPFTCTDETNEVECFLRRYDAILNAASIGISYPGIQQITSELLSIEIAEKSFRIDLRQRALVRIHNGNLQSGGRYYRAFWQRMPKLLRGHLTIDGMAVFEHDFRNCHVRLAYFGSGVEAPTGDLYAIAGLKPSWRTTVKLSIQILLNAASLRQAVSAIAGQLPGKNWNRRLAVARRLIQLIKTTHPALERFWHTGCGLALQYVDSQIIRICLEKLLQRNILGLPVHDSVIAQAKHQVVLKDIMERTFEIEGKKLARERLRYFRRRGFCDRDLTVVEASVGAAAHYTSQHTGTVRSLRPSRGKRRSRSANRTPSPKAARLDNGAIPRLVDIKGTAPWRNEGIGRSIWFKNYPSSAGRQLQAAIAIMNSGDIRAVNLIRRNLEELIMLRESNCMPKRLPVDGLIEQLQLAMKAVSACPDIGGHLPVSVQRQTGSHSTELAKTVARDSEV